MQLTGQRVSDYQPGPGVLDATPSSPPGRRQALRGEYWIQAFAVEEFLPEWDRFLEEAGADIVQSSIWALSKRALGQTPILIEARDQHGEILAGALVIGQRAVAGLRIGYIARGPVVPSGDASLMSDVLRVAMRACAEREYVGIIVQPFSVAPGYNDAFGELGFFEGGISVAPQATISVGLDRPEEEILSAMRSTRRYNIRKSLRDGVKVEPSEDVPLFHRLYLKKARRRGFSAVSLNYLTAQWNALAPHHAVRLLVAHGPAGPAAAVWLTRFAGTVTFRLGGWDADASGTLRVNDVLHWTAIKLARAEGAHSYDLGGFDAKTAKLILSGESPPRGFEKGPSHFKLGFSRVPTLLPAPRMTLFNRPANWLARRVAPAILGMSLVRAAAQRRRSG